MKKFFAIFMAAILMTGWQYSSAGTVAAADEAGSSEMTVDNTPVVTFYHSIDPNWHGGAKIGEARVGYDFFYIIAIPEYYDQLVALAQQYDPTGSTVKIYDPGDSTVYPRYQLNAIAKQIKEQGKDLGVIDAFYFNDLAGEMKNGVKVFIDEKIPITETLKQQLIDLAQIENLQFWSGEDVNVNTSASSHGETADPSQSAASSSDPASTPPPSSPEVEASNPNTGAV